MTVTMAKTFEAPDDLRTPPKTEVAVVALAGATVARFTLAPGWRWRDCIGPTAGTGTCQVHHLGVIAAGRMRIVAADGAEHEVGPGSAYVIAPGHDAWVVGDEPVVLYEFDSAAASGFGSQV